MKYKNLEIKKSAWLYREYRHRINISVFFKSELDRAKFEKAVEEILRK